MNVAWTPDAWEYYLYWQATDKKTLRRIIALMAAIVRDPYTGMGKPEPLRHQWPGYWSRRIDREHRLVYKVADSAAHLRWVSMSTRLASSGSRGLHLASC